MADITQEAIQELNLALSILMPDTLEPQVDMVTALCIQSVTPTGLGGFIELAPGGSAYIHGRRINARYCVILQGINLDNLQTSVNTVIETLLGAEKESLLENGVLKMTQSGNEYQTLTGNNREFKLTFDLIFEYLQSPEETEEIIEEIPVNLELDTGDD